MRLENVMDLCMSGSTPDVRVEAFNVHENQALGLAFPALPDPSRQ